MVLTEASYVRAIGTLSKMTMLPCTPPKINIEPENYGLEDDFPF